VHGDEEKPRLPARCLALPSFFRGSRSRVLGSRFAELQDDLVGVPANRLVEHFCRAGVRRIGENRTLGVELEARGFDLSAHGRGLDAMQGLGYICGSTQSALRNRRRGVTSSMTFRWGLIESAVGALAALFLYATRRLRCRV
jgi:hypothetical protein